MPPQESRRGTTLGLDIVLNKKLVLGNYRKFECRKREFDQPFEEEAGLKESFRGPSPSGDATEEET